MSKMLKNANKSYYEYLYSDLYTNGKLDKEKIQTEITKIKASHEKKCQLYRDTDKIIEIGNTYYNLHKILRLLDLSANITKFWGGFVEIDETHIYSLQSGKWRKKGSAVWSKKGVSFKEIIEISNSTK